MIKWKNLHGVITLKVYRFIFTCMKTLKVTFLLLFLSTALFAQTALQASSAVMAKAYADAKSQNKKVLLIFHASWCGWCKKMDASLNDPACKKMFDDNYVITWLDVMEQPEKANLENPGAMEVMTKYGGEKSGLPFWLILNADGKELANSLMAANPSAPATPADNVGCPASAKEVVFFGNIIKATSPLTDNRYSGNRKALCYE